MDLFGPNSGEYVERNTIVSSLINNLVNYINIFQQKGFNFFIDEWQRNDLFYNKNVSLIHNNTIINGIDIGVDSVGQLLIKQDDIITAYSSGETSFAKTI